MHWQPMLRLFFSWSCFMALGVLAALVLATVSAAPPDKANSNPPKVTDPPLMPFVQPFIIRPENMAALSIGDAFAPASGPLCSFSSLLAGTHSEVQVWDLRGPLSTRPGRIQIGASSLFLAGFGPATGAPLVELAILQAGDDMKCWDLINTDEVRPIPKMLLENGSIRDRNGIFNGDPEIETYWKILVLAHYTSSKAFAKAARHDVTYTHLFTEPERYRGQVIHVEGRLIKLRRFDPPDEARGEGVNNLYEGWIMTDAYGENPLCVVFTELPPGLKIDGDRRLSIEVGFDGYFYKRYRYKAFDTKKANQFRDAPLLIGHTLTGRFGLGIENEASDNWGHNLLWVFFGIMGSAVLVVVGLTCWFRYHDQRIRRRISAIRDKGFVPPDEMRDTMTDGSDDGRAEPTLQPSVESGRGSLGSDFPQLPK